MTVKELAKHLEMNKIKIFEIKDNTVFLCEIDAESDAYSGVRLTEDTDSFNAVIEVNADYNEKAEEFEDKAEMEDIEYDPEEYLEDIVDNRFGELLEEHGFTIHNVYKYGTEFGFDDTDEGDDSWGITVEYIRSFKDEDIEEAIETIKWALEEDFWVD